MAPREKRRGGIFWEDKYHLFVFVLASTLHLDYILHFDITITINFPRLPSNSWRHKGKTMGDVRFGDRVGGREERRGKMGDDRF